MEQTKPKAGLNKWVFLGVIVTIIAIAGFMFSDMFADVRTTLALMVMTGVVVYMWGRRKNRQMLSSNEIAMYIANQQVRDGQTLQLDPTANNTHVEESGIDRVLVCFIREMWTFTYSRPHHKIIESFPGLPIEIVNKRRHDSEYLVKLDDFGFKAAEERMRAETEM